MRRPSAPIASLASAVALAMAAGSAPAAVQALIGGTEAARLETYLDSTWPDGRALPLADLTVGPDGRVRERLHGDLRALAMILKAHPQARCRIAVRAPAARAAAEARAVVRALVQAGAPAGRLQPEAHPANSGAIGAVEITVLDK